MEPEQQTPETPRPYLVSILVENRPGVLARVAALFSARGYNIEGLTAAHAEAPEKSRITCLTWGDSQTIERIAKQLRNLVEVVGVSHGPLEDRRLLGREMVLVRVGSQGRWREVLEVARRFKARLISKGPDRLLLEATGPSTKLASFLQALEPYGLEEVARSGPVVMSGRSKKAANSHTRKRHPGKLWEEASDQRH